MKGSWILKTLEEKKLPLLDYALDTLDWLTPSFLKNHLQNVHGETNTQSNTCKKLNPIRKKAKSMKEIFFKNALKNVIYFLKTIGLLLKI